MGIGYDPASIEDCGPIPVVELSVRATSTTDPPERRVEYLVGPRSTPELSAFAERCRRLMEEDSDRRWLLGARGDVSWGEVLAVLDVLAGLGIAPGIERPAGLSD